MTHPGLSLRGPLLEVSSAVLFGASTPLAKLLIQDMEPVMLAALLYLGSGLGLTVAFLSRNCSVHRP